MWYTNDDIVLADKTTDQLKEALHAIYARIEMLKKEYRNELAQADGEHQIIQEIGTLVKNRSRISEKLKQYEFHR